MQEESSTPESEAEQLARYICTQHNEGITFSHMTWLTREMAKLMQRDMDLARREQELMKRELRVQEREEALKQKTKKYPPRVKHHADTSDS